MGGDGGSIARRIEQVKMKAKEERPVDPLLLAMDKATLCAMTQEQLSDKHGPIMSCELGNLYNRESVLIFLASRKDPKEEFLQRVKHYLFDHVRSMKDVTPLKVKWSDEKSESYDLARRMLVCPVAGTPYNGKHRFVRMVQCGCVLSERAVLEVPGSRTCLVCGEPGPEPAESDAAAAGGPAKKVRQYIPLNGTVEEVDVLREEMFARRKAAKAEKAEKKREAAAAAAADDAKGAGHERRKADADGNSSGASEGAKTKRAKIDAKAAKLEEFQKLEAAKLRPLKPAQPASACNQSEVYKSIFLPPASERKREIPGLCSTKYASAMGML